MSLNEMKKIKAMMHHAIDLRNQSHITQAIAYLRPQTAALQSIGPACALLGSLYWDLNDFRKSALWFAKAAALAPQSEMASLGLFHALWNLKKYDDAFDEMRRFFLVGNTKEYKTLLRDLTMELSLPPPTSQRLSNLDRHTIVDAEKVGLDWRNHAENGLTPMDSLEVQHA